MSSFKYDDFIVVLDVISRWATCLVPLLPPYLLPSSPASGSLTITPFSPSPSRLLLLHFVNLLLLLLLLLSFLLYSPTAVLLLLSSAISFSTSNIPCPPLPLSPPPFYVTPSSTLLYFLLSTLYRLLHLVLVLQIPLLLSLSLFSAFSSSSFSCLYSPFPLIPPPALPPSFLLTPHPTSPLG